MFWRKKQSKDVRPPKTPYDVENQMERIFETMFKKFIEMHCNLGYGRYIQLDTLACAFGAFMNDSYVTTAHLSKILTKSIPCVIVDEKIVCGLDLVRFMTEEQFNARISTYHSQVLGHASILRTTKQG